MREDMDNELLQLFEEENKELSEEPFLAELRMRIKKARGGYVRIYWLATALLLAACAAVSNFVIYGVTLFCDELSRVLQSAGALLITPVGVESFTIPASWVVVTAVALFSMLFRPYLRFSGRV